MYRAPKGSGISVNSVDTIFAGARSTQLLKADRRHMELISQAIDTKSAVYCDCNKFIAPFVHMGLRYGGPMLNTAATRMYWKHEIKNKTEFS